MLKLFSPDLRKLPTKLTSVFNVQSFSTQLEPQVRLQTFRTSEDDPTKHNDDHVGQYYKVSKEDKNQIFLYGGLPKTYEVQAKTFVETGLMIRKPSIDIINCLKTFDFSKPTIRFVMYGEKGNGKSLSLAHILHYAYRAGYLLVHVPWVGNWMRRCKESSNSETKEGYIDLNLDAAAWLIHFKNQNAHHLNNPELKVSQDHVWNKRETTHKDEPLLKLIEHGISRIKYASECIVVLGEEIKKLSTNGKCKTLVAIDGYNAFFYPTTRVRTEKKEIVHPSSITLTEAFLNLTKFDWCNGAAVVTVDEIAIAEEDQTSYLPRYLLGKSGFEHLDPFVPVLIPRYTDKEFKSNMDYYRERRWVEPIEGQDEELKFLSALNPYKLMELCKSL